VQAEFRTFLRCGWLAGGFARFRCGRCGTERLVAFSCKGRGFGPSCGARRMVERAAHLVDAVLPDVPVRQWVLTLPLRLRYRLAWDHDLCRAVVGVFLRAVFALLRRRAAWDGVAGGRGGAVTILQRFGGALNLNVHVHALVLDGCYVQGPARQVRFHPIDEFTPLDVAETLHDAQVGITRLLERWPRDDAGWVEEAPATGILAAASVEHVVALGHRRGQPVARVGAARDEDATDVCAERCHARWDGFDLDASHVVPAGARARLERLCRYVLRPPVVSERLQPSDDGQVLWQLARPWRDGTTHVPFDPCDFLGRLAVLVPRPRVNLLFYHGVLGARSSWRGSIVPRGATHASETLAAASQPRSEATPPGRRQWADLMRRSFGCDVLACDRCGGRLRLIALIYQAEIVRRILTHLGVPADVPTPQPARAPPLDFVFTDH